MIWSASRTVESRCAIAIVVRSRRGGRGPPAPCARSGVEGARRLVEHEDGRVAEDRPRDRHALLLPAREAVAALAHHRVVAVRQGRDEGVDPRGAGGLLDLLVGRVGLGEAQVLPDGSVEEVGLLRDDADRARDRGHRRAADVDPVDGDAAAVDVVEACDEVADGRLPGPRLADERGRRPCGHVEADVLEGPRALAVAEPDVVEGDVAAAGREVDGVLAFDDLYRLVEVLEHAVEERERRLRVELHIQEGADRPEKARLQCRERDDGAEGDSADEALAGEPVDECRHDREAHLDRGHHPAAGHHPLHLQVREPV